MIAEGLLKLEELVKRSHRANALGINGPRHAMYDVKGEIVEKEMRPGARNHEVATIESLARATRRAIGKGEVVDSEPASVWVSLENVVCVLDDTPSDHRVDTITLPLSPSPMLETLAGLRPMEQKPFVRMLDHDFTLSEISPENLGLAVGNLKWETTDEQVGEHKPTVDRMGHDVRSKVTGESDLPSRVSFEFEPYPSLADELDDTVMVMCSLRALVDERKLQLCPLPGELDKATTKAVSIIRRRVEQEFGETFSVFCGTP